MTPGEAKRGYSFINDIILELPATYVDELNNLIYGLYMKYSDEVDYKRVLYLLRDSFSDSDYEDSKEEVLQSFIKFGVKDDESKNLYIKHLRNILMYVCSNKKVVDSILKPYLEYDEKLKKIDNNNKDNFIDEKLDGLIGLDNVKSKIRELSNLAYVNKLRKDKGLKTSGVTMHMVFTGSPGTGKTTVARIIAELYYNLGIIKENKMIEVSREDLVAEYLGQSEIKTKKVLESAMGGVLFIDEAYSLTKNKDEYGSAVIDTILKFMEDNRDNTVIIVAGYPKEIEQFIQSNPGLKSRFNTYINFENYNSEELLKILQMLINSNDYKISDKDLKKILKQFDKIDTKDVSFANGRYVRNLFENAIKNQASRISMDSGLDEEKLQTLIYEDFFKD